MNYRTATIVFLSSAITLPFGFAESTSEHDLKQLQADRAKALAAAREPIDRRYQAALEQLLRHATQAGDLEAAIKIKGEITGLGGATTTTTTTINGEPRPRENLRSFLPGTTWTSATKPDGISDNTMTFGKDGFVTFSTGERRKWEFKDHNTIKIDGLGLAVFNEGRTGWGMKDKARWGNLKE